jgi:hypothetical protein
MNTETETAKRYRRHAEELRTIAADKQAKDNRQALLRLALDYERMADTMDAIAQTDRTMRMR